MYPILQAMYVVSLLTSSALLHAVNLAFVALSLTRVQNGQTNDLFALIAYDDIICEFTIRCTTRFFEVDI
jgi:hypothetical protein